MSTSRVVAARPTTPTWRLSDAAIVGVLLVALMVVGAFVEFIFLRPLHLFFSLTDYQRSEIWLLLLLVVQFATAAVVVIGIASRRALGDPLASIGWNASSNEKLWGFAGFGFAGLVTLASVLVFGGIPRFADGFAPASIFLYVLTTVLAQPFMEECYFRGILFAAVADKLGDFGAAITTAVLFTVLHFRHYRWVIFPLALVLGLVRMRTKSVASCFVLHGGYNLGIVIFELLRWR